MGEKPGRREQMDRFVRQMVKEGYSHKAIKEKAIECALKADRKEQPKGGKK